MKHSSNIVMHWWKSIFHLPFGRRLVLFGSFFTIIFLFFPWFSENLRGDAQQHDAFGRFAIFGIVALMASLTSIMLVLREIFAKKGFVGSVPHGKILIFALGVAVYTIIIATFVFHEFAAEFSFSHVHLGLGLTFVSLGISLAGALFSQDFIPKGPEQKVFAEPHEVDPSRVNLHPEDPSQLSFDERP